MRKLGKSLGIKIHTKIKIVRSNMKDQYYDQSNNDSIFSNIQITTAYELVGKEIF